MKKENRILKNDDFSRIIKSGKKFHTSLLSFYFLKNQNKSFRVGISISKKVSKLAVIRNKIKRQINASLVQNKFNLNLDLIIIAKKEILNKDYQKINSEIMDFIIKNAKERVENEG